MGILNVVLYTSICKMKRPLVGPFFGRFYFTRKVYRMMHMKFLYIWNIGSREEEFYIFPYISLCKMKRPLVGPFLGGFYFYEQIWQTMSQGCCMSNTGVFRLPVHEKKNF